MTDQKSNIQHCVFFCYLAYNFFKVIMLCRRFGPALALRASVFFATEKY